MRFFFIVFSFISTVVQARDLNLQECEARYQDAAGAFTSRGLNEDYSFIPIYGVPSLLSYKGKKAIMFDGTSFANVEGVLRKSVQEVMASGKSDNLNAGLVFEFLRSADNDSDYPAVQLMALELQPKFPNVLLDAVLYWIVSGNPNVGEPMDLPFCRGNLWTWSEIKTWLENEGIPAFLKKEPKLVEDKTVCSEKVENGETILNCKRE